MKIPSANNRTTRTIMIAVSIFVLRMLGRRLAKLEVDPAREESDHELFHSPSLFRAVVKRGLVKSTGFTNTHKSWLTPGASFLLAVGQAKQNIAY